MSSGKKRSQSWRTWSTAHPTRDHRSPPASPPPPPPCTHTCTGQSDWWPLLTVHAPSGMQPSPAYLRSGQAAQSGGLGLPPAASSLPRSLIPNKWEVHELHFVRANLGLARRRSWGECCRLWRCPAPTSRQVSSTEPFDGIERLAVSFKFTFTWHPEFKSLEAAVSRRWQQHREPSSPAYSK
jgi:hypothetical protein